MPMQFTPEQRRELQTYEGVTLCLTQQLNREVERVTVLMGDYGERRGDPEWRARISAEYRSWRRILDAMPLEAPDVYAAAHARILRWATAVAEHSRANAVAQSLCETCQPSELPSGKGSECDSALRSAIGWRVPLDAFRSPTVSIEVASLKA